MSPPEPRLEISIKDHFAPLLRNEGFAGSGLTFHKVESGLIFVVNMQKNKWGGSFALNMAIHPELVPLSNGSLPDRKTIKEYDCELRRRLAYGWNNQWWEYGKSQESMDKAVRASAQVYSKKGAPILAAYAGDASPMVRMTPETLLRGRYDMLGFPSGPRLFLLFARLRMAQNKIDDAKEFARLGLAKISQTSFTLRKELQDIIDV